MSKKKENPMPMKDIIKRMNEIRLKKMAEAKSKMIKSGKKFCKKCETDKPFSEYASEGNGRCSAYCKQCNANYNKNRTIHASENLTDWYIKDFGRRHYGLAMKSYFSPELMDALKHEILARRAAKSMLTIDGRTFKSLNKFSLYVQEKYGVGHHAVKARLYHGKPIEQVILDEQTARSAFTGGGIKIKVVNNQTEEVQYFLSISKAARTLRVGETMLKESLRTGCSTRLYNNSKTKFTYKIYKDGKEQSVNDAIRRTFNRFENGTQRIEGSAY